jgi:alpha-glucosidase
MRHAAWLLVLTACGPSPVEAPDADRGPLAHCAAPAPPPDWVDVDAAGLVARCGAIELAADALDGGATRVRYAMTGAAAPRSWAVLASPAAAPVVAVAGVDDAVELCTPELRVRVDAACRLRAELPDGTPIAVDASGFTATDEPLEGTPVPAVRLDRVALADRVLGTGERTGTTLDRRGRRLAFWNTDAYDPAHGGWAPDADPLYQGIPLEVRTRIGDGLAYGLFTDEPHRMVMDLGASDPTRDALVAYGGPGAVRGAGAPGTLTQYLLPGPTMADVVARYTALVGRAPRPPRWALGYHQSRWGYPDRQTIEAVADRFAADGIPLAAMWLDIQHMSGFRTFTWDDSRFGDRAAFTAAMRARGVRTIAIADPGIKIDPAYATYATGVAGGHFLREPGGDVYAGVAWPGAAAFPDVTRAATRAWWGDAIAELHAAGIDGIWLDVNEPTTFPESGGTTVPVTLPVDGDGAPTTMAEAHQVYPLLQATATYAALAATGERPFVLSRAGYAGIQRVAAVWTGDVPSTWDGLGATLPMLLGLGVSGVPFVGSDIGGYSGHASPELYARWIALGAVSPFARGHVTNGVPGQEPWMFGDAITPIARAHLQTRARLLPYLESVFAEAAATGAPVLRPLAWHFPELADVADQAMLGPSIMVAPVVTAGATARRVVFPPGRWIELPSLRVVDGPATLDVDAPLAALPMWAREGAIIPTTDGIELFPGASTTLTVIDDDGLTLDGPATTTALTLVATDDGARLTWTRTGDVPASATLTLRFHPIEDPAVAAFLDGEPIAATTSDRTTTITVPATAHELRLVYSSTLLDTPVSVPFTVDVPPGTTSVHLATSATSWAHHPMTLTGTRATTTLSIPRGTWFDYKYTRGDWSTVEKTASCAELPNRTRVSAPTAHPDRVARWRDTCPN